MESFNNPKTQEELVEEFKKKFFDEVRQERNKRLSETDFVHMADVSVTEEYKVEMNAYRQQLRDIPEVAEMWLADKDLFSVSVWGIPWPEKP